jgi:hypothetical protein
LAHEKIGLQFGPTGIFSDEFLAFAADFLDTDLTGFELLIAFVELGGFIAAARGVLGPGTAAELIAQVEAITAQLGCTPVGSPSGAFLDGCELNS